jgi:hypothetical protein
VTRLGMFTSIAASAGFPARGLTFMTLSSGAVVTVAPRLPLTCRTVSRISRRLSPVGYD